MNQFSFAIETVLKVFIHMIPHESSTVVFFFIYYFGFALSVNHLSFEMAHESISFFFFWLYNYDAADSNWKWKFSFST